MRAVALPAQGCLHASCSALGSIGTFFLLLSPISYPHPPSQVA